MIEFNTDYYPMNMAKEIEYREKPDLLLRKEEIDLLKSAYDYWNYTSKNIYWKHIDWKYEEEFRIIGKQGEKVEYEPKSIKGIYFGAKCTEENQKKIISASNHIPGIIYYKTIYTINKYELRYEVIET